MSDFKRVFLFVMIILFNLSFVFSFVPSEDWIYKYDSSEIYLNLQSHLDLQFSSGAQIDFVQIKDYFYPRENNNLLDLSMSYIPKVPEKSSDGSLIFLFNNPTFRSVAFGVSANLSLKNNIKEVKSRIDYPLDISSIDSDLWVYMRPSDHIDSDDSNIRDLASKLVSNDDDLYSVVFKIGSWVKNNINYSLDSSTEDVTEKASWVLLNKKGVCDELTSLFIALLRSSGVPARYVSGLAYTNSKLFARNWGFHGWAQVYFPGYGWIDFDPTYGQFGFVDMSHIPLRYSVDSGESSTKYSMKSYNVNMVSWPMSYDVKIKSLSGVRKDNVDVSVNLNSDKFGLNSYGLIIADVKNNNNFYYPLTLRISDVSNLDYLGSSDKTILLRPFESKKVYWIFKIKNLRSGNYIFPVEVYTLSNQSFKSKFNVGPNYKNYNLESIKSLIGYSDVDVDTDLGISSNSEFSLDCKSLKSVYYSYEPVNISCSGLVLDGYSICADDKCSDFKIDGNKYIANLNFRNAEKFVDSGMIILDLRKNNISKKNIFLSTKVFPNPIVSIENLTYPKSVSYGDDFDLFFRLNPVYYSGVVNLTLSFGLFTKTWNLKLNDVQPFKVILTSKDFLYKTTSFNLDLVYSDLNGHKYNSSKNFYVQLENVSSLNSVELFFNRLSKYLLDGFDFLTKKINSFF